MIDTANSAAPPKVSVVIPCFNAGQWLATSVTSALTQTHRDLEVVIVDDGSEDNSLEVAQRLAKSDTRVRVLARGRAGVEEARNLGIREGKGEWIAFLDADDWWESNKLKAQLSLAAVREELQLIGTYGRYWSQDGRRSAGALKLGPISDDDLAQLRLRFKPIWLLTPSVLAKRSALLSIGGFNVEFGGAAEDLDLWTRLAYTHHAAVVPEPLTNVRVSANSASMKRFSDIQRHTLWIRENLRRSQFGESSLNRAQFELWFNGLTPRARQHLYRTWRSGQLFRAGAARALNNDAIGGALLVAASFFVAPSIPGRKLATQASHFAKFMFASKLR